MLYVLIILAVDIF